MRQLSCLIYPSLLPNTFLPRKKNENNIKTNKNISMQSPIRKNHRKIEEEIKFHRDEEK